MDISRLRSQWQQISGDETREAVIDHHFILPLLTLLGFGESDRLSSFDTGSGIADVAARFPTKDCPPFAQERLHPDLIVELKAPARRSRNTPTQTVTLSLEDGSAHQARALSQLRQLLAGEHCRHTRWGLITNARHLQLFQRHGHLVYPATPNFEISGDRLEAIVQELRACLECPPRCTTVCIYNHKGGVGKTTTTINLGATLAVADQAVLLVDCDPQGDLSRSLEIAPTATTLANCLQEPSLPISAAIRPFDLRLRSGNSIKSAHIFDVIPATPHLQSILIQAMQTGTPAITRLREVLQGVRDRYDYILLDCPSAWLFLSKSAVYASDVVLIPTRHTDLSSLNNAAQVIHSFIFGEIHTFRREGGPLPLPIFFNGAPTTDKAMAVATAEIEQILQKFSHLTPYFWPHYQTNDTTVFAIPEYAIISRAAFARVPAVFKDKRVLGFYQNLVQTYFYPLA
ncbi:ParA family protein [Thermosynechococcaceae cyanobacterium Okahandja]